MAKKRKGKKYQNYATGLTKSAVANIMGQHVVGSVSAATGIPVPAGVTGAFGLLETGDFAKTAKNVLKGL